MYSRHRVHLFSMKTVSSQTCRFYDDKTVFSEYILITCEAFMHFTIKDSGHRNYIIDTEQHLGEYDGS